MTVGKDVSSLFPDVVNCMQTEDLELKKLVYLYLINYAKTNPAMAIMGVNTFVKDTSHRSPLIRALAVRTMGCIRVDKITEYLCKPLQRCLADEDPYVKKTAAMCVAKLFDISPSMVRDQGFLDQLRELICDANPMVVANAVAALSEILSDRDVLELTTTVLQKLLAALNECSEWGQVFILDFLAKFTPGDAAQAENIIERVLPRLKHSNSAVVLSAVKIVMRYLEIISNKETVSRFCRKLSPPLVTLSQSPQSEIQYVALRNINLVVQKRPDLLVHKIKVFFCKYSDPIYVKMEKLEILVRLASERNIDQLLQELKEYASEVDVDFVRKSVSTIGRCAIKLERAAERCIKVLLQLIQTEVNYVVQEAVVVIKNIFRKYPNRYESVIGVLCDALDTLDEPEAKASMVWIIGEYSNRIENADELLETFLETFDDEPPMVQLQLLTATVKLFLRRPSKGKDMVQAVLTQATENSDNPDLRDRGYVYWRLLSCDPAGAKDVVLAEKPVISDDTNQLEESQLNDLIGHIATLSSIYHKSPEEIITKKVRAEEDDDLSDGSSMYSSDGEDETNTPTPGTGAGAGAGGGPAAPVEDLLGLGFGDTAAPAAPTSAAPPAATAGGLGDLFGTPAPAPPAVPPAAPAATASSSSAGAPKLLGSDFGLAFKGRFVRQGGNTVFQVQLQNSSSAPVSTCSLSMNKNLFGLTATSAVVTFNAAPGASALAAVPCTFSNTHFQPGATSLALDIAVRNDSVPSQVIFFKGVEVPLTALLSEDGAIAREQYVPTWGSLAASAEKMISGLPSANGDHANLIKYLQASNVFYAAQRPVDGGAVAFFFSAKVATGQVVLAQLTFKPGFPACKATVKSASPLLTNLMMEALPALIIAGESS